MAGLVGRLAPWLEVVDDLLRQRLTAYPHGTLVRQFGDTFDAEPSWNWVNADGEFGFELLRPPPGWPTAGELEYWRIEGMPRHPLMKWFAATQQIDAQTIGRVPSNVAGRQDRELVTSALERFGLDEQLAIPYTAGAAGLRLFVIARTGTDFDDDDVELARRLQPLLMLLDRQVRVLQSMPPAACQNGHAASLTGRELAVIQLLAEGLTAVAISHRLASSPRTVHKHLEHIYRKLEVADRLTAVRTAELQGLITGAAT